MKNKVPVSIQGLLICIFSNRRYYQRKWDDLCYVATCDHYCEFFFNSGSPIVAKISLEKLMAILPEISFYRCHKKFLIHLKIINEAVVFVDHIDYRGKKIDISRDTIDVLIQKSLEYQAGLVN